MSKNSLQTRLLLALLLTSALPLLAFGSYAAWLEGKDRVNIAIQSQLDLAQAASEEIDILVKEYKLDAEIIAGLPTIQAGEAAQRQELLEKLFSQYKRYGQLAFIEADSGTLLQAGNPAGIGMNVSHIQSFQVVRDTQQQSFVVAPVPNGGPLVLHIHTPIVQKDGEVAILGSPVPFNGLRASVNQLVQHNQCNLFLSDRRGTIFVDSESLPHPDGDEPVWDHHQRIAQSDATRGTFESEEDGVLQLVAFVKVTELDWTVVVAQDMSTILESSRDERQLFLGGAILTALVSSLIAYLLSSMLTRPLGVLAAAFEKFGAGKPLDLATVTASQVTEYQTLGRAFSEMQSAIVDRENQLANVEASNHAVIKAKLEEATSTNRAIIRAIPDSFLRLNERGIVVAQALKPPFLSIAKQLETSSQNHLFSTLMTAIFSENQQKDVDWYQLQAQILSDQELRLEIELVIDKNPRFIEFTTTRSQDQHHLVVMRDVTARRTSEQRLHMAQKFESIGVLVGGLAHDFNNYLSAIMGNLSVVELKLDETHSVQKNVQRALMASRNAADLIRNLRGLSNDTTSEMTTVSVNDVLGSTIELLQTTLPIGTKIEAELMPQIGLLHGDATQLQQVAMNLLINAYEAVDDVNGGCIDVTTDQIAVDQNRPIFGYDGKALLDGNYVVIRISDDGQGMDVETLQRMFDPYFSTKDRGSGLGLSSVISIVNAHRGSIQIESSVGNGTTVEIYLPVVAGEIVERELVTSATQLDGTTVLVIDDNEAILNSLRDLLETSQMTVFTASDGYTAVQLYGRSHQMIDIVICDIQMPNMDGFETFRQLSALNPAIKIIFSSGFYDALPDDVYALNGTADLICKPYGHDNLLEKLSLMMTS